MTIFREMRESALTVLGPVPYLVLLLPVLSFSADVSPVAFLFVFTMVLTFYYLLVVRAVNEIRSNFAELKKNVPDHKGEYLGETYRERFVSISYECFFGVEANFEPITDYTSERLFPNLVYAFWGTVVSFAVFLISGVFFKWLIDTQTVQLAGISLLSGDLIQNLPLGILNFLLVLVPLFKELTFETRVFIGGVTFLTGLVFLTAARNLSTISDDLHHRALRSLVEKNPVTKNELINTLLLIGVYSVLMYFT